MNKLSKTIKFLIMTFFIWAVSAVCFETSVWADEIEETVYSVVILDEAEILTPEQELELWPHMTQLENYGNIIFRTVVLDSGANFEQDSENTYYEMFGNEPGVIFQIDMGNRKLTLSSSTGMDEILAKERDSIVDNIYRYATDEDYLKCASECFDQIYTIYNDGVIAHKMKYIDNAILALILSLIVNFIVVFASEKKPTDARIVSALIASVAVEGANVKKNKANRVYSPIYSDSSGSGGSSGGGGGGGGFSGGSSSHGF